MTNPLTITTHERLSLSGPPKQSRGAAWDLL